MAYLIINVIDVATDNTMPNIKKSHRQQTSFAWEIIFILFIAWTFIVGKNYYAHHPVNFINPSLFFKSITTIKFNLLFNYLTSLGALLLIHQSCLYVGAFTLNRFFKINSLNTLEKYVISSALGLVIFSYLTFTIGLLGGLYKTVFILLFLSLTILSLLKRNNIKKNLSNIQTAIKPDKNIIDLIIKLSLFVILLIIFIMAFVPDLFYDSLVYHASTANYWVFHHKIKPIYFNRFSFMPLSHSMLFIIGLLLKGESMIKLINFYVICLIVSSVFAISKRLFNSLKIGFLANLFFLTVPLVAMHCWYGGNDLSLALMVSLTYYTLILSFYEDAQQKDKWFLLSAIFAGYASTVKYSVVFTLFPVPLLIFWKLFLINKNQLFFSIKKTLLYSSIVLLMMSPWLLRSLVLTRNPVYPFFSRWFNKESAITRDLTENYISTNKASVDIVKKATKIISSPWNLSIKGIDSFRHIGPVLILVLPFLFFVRKKGFLIFILLAISISYVWFSLFTDKLKYFLPILPLAFLLVSYITYKLSKIFPTITKHTPLLVALIFTLTNINSIALFALQFRPLQLLSGSINKDHYLSVNGPGYPNPPYAVYNYIDQHLPATSKILIIGDAKTFYLKRDYIANTVHDIIPIIEWANDANTIDDLYEVISMKEVTHILVNVNEALRTRNYNINKWTANGMQVFDNFWKRHIKHIYYTNGLFLYEIQTDSTAANHKTPSNILAEIDRNNPNTNLLLNILTKDEMWHGLIKEYEKLFQMGYDVYLPLCYAYLKNGDIRNAKNIYKFAQNKKIATNKLAQMQNLINSLNNK
jgi:hypothetical protein